MLNIDNTGYLSDTIDFDDFNTRSVMHMKIPQIKKNGLIKNIKCIIITISRDKINLGDAVDRIEDCSNTHSRHFSIDRGGRIIQYASIAESIKHITEYSKHVVIENTIINNSNSISIELVNCGKLIKTTHPLYNKSVYATKNSYLNVQQVKKIGDNYYEVIPYRQNTKLFELIKIISNNSKVFVTNGEFWRNFMEFKATPALPLRTFNITN